STRTVLPQANAFAMIGRRAAAGIATKLGKHSLQTTRITAYLKNGGTLEKAAAMASHASTQTTQLYDRRRDGVSLDEVERILVGGASAPVRVIRGSAPELAGSGHTGPSTRSAHVQARQSRARMARTLTSYQQEISEVSSKRDRH